MVTVWVADNLKEILDNACDQRATWDLDISKFPNRAREMQTHSVLTDPAEN